MKPSDDTQSMTGERRTGIRVSMQSKVRLTVENPEFEGRAENVSQTGVLFFSDQDLAVTVEIEEDGVVKRVPGHLVRFQRMRGERTGWAVEFDLPESA